MQAVLKIRKKGIVILPKKIREEIGLNEGDTVLVETRGGEIVFKPLKPIIVDVPEELVDKLLEEEVALEQGKYRKGEH